MAFRTRAAAINGWKGRVIKSSAPSSRARASLPLSSGDIIITTGIPAKRSSRLISDRSSNPSMTGITVSSRITSTGFSFSRASAVFPFTASVMSNVSRNSCVKIDRFFSPSSTISMAAFFSCFSIGRSPTCARIASKGSFLASAKPFPISVLHFTISTAGFHFFLKILIKIRQPINSIAEF